MSEAEVQDAPQQEVEAQEEVRSEEHTSEPPVTL